MPANELLSHEEVCELIRIYRDETRPEAERIAARNEVVRANDALVGRYIRQRKFKPDRADEARQDGRIGLIDAVERFDPGRNRRLSTYAMPWIAVRVRRGSDPRLPVHVPTLAQDARRRVELRGVSFDEPPDAIARKTGLKAEHVDWALAAHEWFSNSRRVEDRRDGVQPPDDVERSDTRNAVAACVARLPDPWNDVIRRAFGVGREPETVAAIARSYSRGPTWAADRRDEALQMLRDMLIQRGIDAA